MLISKDNIITISPLPHEPYVLGYKRQQGKTKQMAKLGSFMSPYKKVEAIRPAHKFGAMGRLKG